MGPSASSGQAEVKTHQGKCFFAVYGGSIFL